MTARTDRPYVIHIYLPEGSPEGLRIIEKSNWIGQGALCPRSVYGENRHRDLFQQTGVYILVGPSESGELPTVYIGEGDPIRPRLDSHQSKKDFWTSAALFISKDGNLNKAHIQYLESRLVSLALDAKRCILDNSNMPSLPSLSDMDAAEAEGFLDEIRLCLPVMGIHVFTKPVATAETSSELLFLSGAGADAKGLESSDGFVVLAGSTGRVQIATSGEAYVTPIREALIDGGVIQVNGELFTITQDYVFGSPSRAAAVMLGRTANGRIEWRDGTGRTLKEIQSEESEESA